MFMFAAFSEMVVLVGGLLLVCRASGAAACKAPIKDIADAVNLGFNQPLGMVKTDKPEKAVKNKETVEITFNEVKVTNEFSRDDKFWKLECDDAAFEMKYNVGQHIHPPDYVRISFKATMQGKKTKKFTCDAKILFTGIKNTAKNGQYLQTKTIPAGFPTSTEKEKCTQDDITFMVAAALTSLGSNINDELQSVLAADLKAIGAKVKEKKPGDKTAAGEQTNEAAVPKCDDAKREQLIKVLNGIFQSAAKTKTFGRPSGIRIDAEKSSLFPDSLVDGAYTITCPPGSNNVFEISSKSAKESLFTFTVSGVVLKEDLLKNQKRRRKRGKYGATIKMHSSRSSTRRYTPTKYSYSSYSSHSDTAELLDRRRREREQAQQAARRQWRKQEQEKRLSGGDPLELQTCIRSITIDYSDDIPNVLGVDHKKCTKITKPSTSFLGSNGDLKYALKNDNFIWNNVGLAAALAESSLGLLLSPEDKSPADAVVACYVESLRTEGFLAIDGMPSTSGSMALSCPGGAFEKFVFVPKDKGTKLQSGDAKGFPKCIEKAAKDIKSTVEQLLTLWQLMQDALCEPKSALLSLAARDYTDVSGVLNDCITKGMQKLEVPFAIAAPDEERVYASIFQCRVGEKPEGATWYTFQNEARSGVQATNLLTEVTQKSFFIDQIADSCINDVLHYPTDEMEAKVRKAIHAAFDRGCSVKSILDGVVARLWG